VELFLFTHVAAVEADEPFPIDNAIVTELFHELGRE
jgi:hypothetical protein